ncbi:MAG: ribosome biogenesis GTPase Der [Thiotrichales bacterium]|nr:ribosome biogenesis GTPase Der [Thiotrichales bacterium]MBT3612901.1 ribosome biogenesis GTPase Der [Thiotrichales bacterium]MBT3752328.1 ribosome biogenesis GTPase Der [Thiotrichales bacterium]MBT3837080.1 ribosome biogenesis GTPase Der [Thiotrichales bacterium]MBT4152499.1 ribosome biogenesis GTPase Der [Thiotrichales bacterium]
MMPVVAIVGRPNVGKSTLFNLLTRTRDALVADFPGLTRDRQYGLGKFEDSSYIVIDTGGLSDDPNDIETLMEDQVWIAVEESDVILFLVDGRGGLTAADEMIANALRQLGKQVQLVVNKTEGIDENIASSEFHAMGLGRPYAISAAHNHRIYSLMERVLEPFIEVEEVAEDEFEEDEFPTDGWPGKGGEGEGEGENDRDPAKQNRYENQTIKVAVIGRPNVGKSTLINRLLGEDRLLAYDMPGTTRDSIEVPFEENGKEYILIDTAGVRRRGKITEAIEKFSVIKAFNAIERSNVVIMVMDAREGMTDQDATLLGMVIDSGRALVIAFNKWDGMSHSERERNRSELERRLHFLDYAKIHTISALHGSGIRDLFAAANRAYRSSTKLMKTPDLTRALEQSVTANPPPLVKGHRIKMRYAHQGGQNPPRIIIHGNQLDSVPHAYRRYLMNQFRKIFKLHGTPIRLEFRTSTNPFAGRKNKLTDRQIKKRERLKSFVKKKKR